MSPRLSRFGFYRMEQTTQLKLPVGSSWRLQELATGYRYALELIAEQEGVKIQFGREGLLVSGDAPRLEAVRPRLEEFIHAIETGKEFSPAEFETWLRQPGKGQAEELGMERLVAVITHKGEVIRALTPGQEAYLEAIQSKDIVFATGPAGTGKTYLAIACAVAAVKRHEVERLVLTRPAVEAGEKLGFLPGDLAEKLDPYLRPVYDALYDTLGAERAAKMKELGQLEVAPLAYMRGRTLNSAFIVLDEAQNTTPAQMKMFLTRLGRGSKALITGDITQIDLEKGAQSGMLHAMKLLKAVSGIGFVQLTGADIVRHRLVAEIVDAYAKEQDVESKEEVDY